MRASCSALLAVLLVAAPGFGGVSAADNPWIAGSNVNAFRGGLRTDAAYAVGRQALLLSLAGELADASNLFQPGDGFLSNRDHLALVWSPTFAWEVGLSGGMALSRWRTSVQSNVQMWGDLKAHAKYGHTIRPSVAVGASVQVSVPATLAGSGLHPAATSVSAMALASYLPWRALELTGNLGWLYDGSDRLGVPAAPDVRFVYGVGAGSGLIARFAAASEWKIPDRVRLIPFMEAGGIFVPQRAWSQMPWTVAFGLKGTSSKSDFVQLWVAMDVRLAGAPVPGASFPGLPPWTLFAGLNILAIDQSDAERTCQTSSDCDHGATCLDERCRYIVAKEETFTICGTVRDADTDGMVADAQVLFEGFEQTPVAVDSAAGTFCSFPLALNGELLTMQITAPSYTPYEQTLRRSNTHGSRDITVALRKKAIPDVGKINGDIKDAKTGKGIAHAHIVFVNANLTMAADSMGRIAAEVPAGRHDILVAAPDYETQTKYVVVHVGETVILNIDLRHSPKHKNNR